MTYVQPTNPAVKDPTKASLPVSQNVALADVNSRLTGVEGDVLPNGSFELPVSGSGDPDSWTIADTGSASHALDQDEADVYHGRQSLLMTLTAAAGDLVTATTDRYIPCAPGQRIRVQWDYKCSVAATRVRVDLLWWYWTGAAYSAASTASSNVYDYSADNPATWDHRISDEIVAPAGAHNSQFYTVQVRYGDPAGGTDGTAGLLHIDGVQTEVYHGMVGVPWDHANNPVTLAGAAADYIIPAGMHGTGENPYQLLVVVEADENDDFTVWSLSVNDSSTTVFDTGTAPAGFERTLTVHINALHQFRADVDTGTPFVYIIGYWV